MNNILHLDVKKQEPIYNMWKLEEMKRNHILLCYEYHNKNKKHTAKALGIGLRTLQRKLKEWSVG